MIDKEKYLYWMNPDDPLLESQLIWREMYSKIANLYQHNRKEQVKWFIIRNCVNLDGLKNVIFVFEIERKICWIHH